jgi:NTP pyrophosphatase (non-canonical NTP hydrolase)
MINLKEYQDFVTSVTSLPSHNLTEFMNRLDRLDSNLEFDEKENDYVYGPNINVPLLLCGAIGLGSETGEFQEIVKKIVFQGKPLTDENVYHMKRELGDIIWYWTNACTALGLDPEDVIEENVKKLESRYTGKKFEIFLSENRKENDL